MTRYRSSSLNSDISGIGAWFQCGCMTVIVIANLVFGGSSVNYLLTTFLGKALPFGWAIITGLFVGEFTIPTAIVVWILKSFHII